MRIRAMKLPNGMVIRWLPVLEANKNVIPVEIDVPDGSAPAAEASAPKIRRTRRSTKRSKKADRQQPAAVVADSGDVDPLDVWLGDDETELTKAAEDMGF